MRISERQIFDGATLRSQLARTRMDEATEVASSGLRINNAADDPAGAAYVTRAKADETRLQSLVDTLGQTVDMTQASDLALGDAGNALQSLYELAVQMGNDTMGFSDRLSAVSQLDNMRGLVFESLNRQFNGRTLFAGAREDGLAFDPNSVPPGAFLGDTNLRSVETAPGITQVVQQRVDVTVDDPTITFDDPNNLTGTPPAPTPTQVSMFQALENLRVALQNNDAPSIRALIAPLSAYVGKIADTRAEAGAQQVALEGAIEVSTLVRDNTRESRSDVEDADSVEAFSELQFSQRALEAALQASGKSFSLSLLDVVR
jgi:flagellin-like hook-associated protein FlgL